MPGPIVKFPEIVIPVETVVKTEPESVRFPFMIITPESVVAPEPDKVK